MTASITIMLDGTMMSWAPVPGAVSYRLYWTQPDVIDRRLVKIRRRHSYSRQMRFVRVTREPLLIGEVDATNKQPA